MTSHHKFFKIFSNVITVVGLGLSVWFFIYGFQQGLFTNSDTLSLFLLKFNGFAPFLFVLLQILQVTFPILPGGLSCAAGVLLFGPWYGFLYNYIGILIGSFINFYLARRYGLPFVKTIISEKSYTRYLGWLQDEKRFRILFALAIFFPFAPDDLLCIIAGLSKISFKRFALIIALCKPASIFLYSIGLTAVLEFLVNFFL
ncbi:MAG: TVP38/TMEM64 family protein [Oscillospiraceae bacterium]|nr:TVP38/TMEM64 family protein [Oscillospiraceae bacterium]